MLGALVGIGRLRHPGKVPKAVDESIFITDGLSKFLLLLRGVFEVVDHSARAANDLARQHRPLVVLVGVAFDREAMP